MGIENPVIIATDSGCSRRSEDVDVRQLEVVMTPLGIMFFDEQDQEQNFSDLEMSIDEYEAWMQRSTKLPKTEGAVPGNFIQTFSQLPEEAQVVSIQLTGAQSGAYGAARVAAEMVTEECPGMEIEVVDGQTVSLAQWFLVEEAARMAQAGAGMVEIVQSVKDMRGRVKILTALASLENAIEGGRVSDAQGLLASLLKIKPILGVVDGKVVPLERPRTMGKAKQRLVEMAGDAGPLVKLAVVHTQAPKLAEELREMLGGVYAGEINIYEERGVIRVHAGVGAVAVAFMTK